MGLSSEKIELSVPAVNVLFITLKVQIQLRVHKHMHTPTHLHTNKCTHLSIPDRLFCWTEGRNCQEVFSVVEVRDPLKPPLSYVCLWKVNKVRFLCASLDILTTRESSPLLQMFLNTEIRFFNNESLLQNKDKCSHTQHHIPKSNGHPANHQNT